VCDLAFERFRKGCPIIRRGGAEASVGSRKTRYREIPCGRGSDTAARKGPRSDTFQIRQERWCRASFDDASASGSRGVDLFVGPQLASAAAHNSLGDITMGDRPIGAQPGQTAMSSCALWWWLPALHHQLAGPGGAAGNEDVMALAHRRARVATHTKVVLGVAVVEFFAGLL